MNYILHTLDGVKDFLPEEFSFKQEIENRIEKVFKSYGYLRISTPMFEFQEVFSEKGVKGFGKIFKFLDRDGSTLALRTNMTPPIARIVATSELNLPIPYRFSYIENSFRNTKTLQGKSREFTQGGIELIGVNSVESDAEVLSTAIHSLLNTGLINFKIMLGHVGFLQGILSELGLEKNQTFKIQDLILKKSFVDLEEYISKLNIDPTIKNIFLELQFLSGNIDVIKNTKKIITNKKSVQAIDNLINIYNILKEENLEKYISFDLSSIGYFDYYTGIIFSAYCYGTGFSVLDGGRYDELIKKFDTDYPAIGFAIKINDLLEALSNQGKDYELKKIKALVVFTKDGRKTALQTANKLREKDLLIENSLLGEDLETNKKYATDKNINSILYFTNEKTVSLIDLLNESENKIEVSELANKF